MQNAILKYIISILLAKLLIPSKYYNNIAIGQQIEIKIDETNENVIAVIAQIGAVIEPASSMLQIFCEIDNKDGKMRSGMTGTTNIKYEA